MLGNCDYVYWVVLIVFGNDNDVDDVVLEVVELEELLCCCGEEKSRVLKSLITLQTEF